MQTEKYPLKLTIEKSGDMIYFSQLDLASVLTRALRRAELPLYYTQGFSPRVKMSFGRALKLGLSGREEVTFYFTEKITAPELQNRLSPRCRKDWKLSKLFSRQDYLTRKRILACFEPKNFFVKFAARR